MTTETLQTGASTDQLAVIEKSFETLKDGGRILLSHQARVSKAITIADTLLKQAEENDGKLNPDLDKSFCEFIAICTQRKEELEGIRKPITQMMDKVRGLFTTEEKKLDVKDPGTKIYKLHQYRNQYARDLSDAEEKRRKEADRVAKKSKEQAELRESIQNLLARNLLNYLSGRKQLITESFNNITLVTYDEKALALKAMSTDFAADKLEGLCSIQTAQLPGFYFHQDLEVQAFIVSERSAYDYNSFYKQYTIHITELKQSLIDRLASKKLELQQLARASEDDKIRLEEEKRTRESEAAKRLEEENQRRIQEANKKAEEKKIQESTMAMFTQAASSAPTTAMPEAKEKYLIKILKPAGIVEIFTFWFQSEAGKLTIEELEAKTMKQIKTFCESEFNKNSRRIESINIEYVKDVTAVNRKAK